MLDCDLVFTARKGSGTFRVPPDLPLDAVCSDVVRTIAAEQHWPEMAEMELCCQISHMFLRSESHKRVTPRIARLLAGCLHHWLEHNIDGWREQWLLDFPPVSDEQISAFASFLAESRGFQVSVEQEV